MNSNVSRTLLVTLLGAFARRTEDWMPVKGIVTLLDALDVDESSVRTGVSRLKSRGWLVPEKRDDRNGYRLTEVAKASLASGDEVIWHARQPALMEDGWCIATFSVPEELRAKRHRLRGRLLALGFGNLGQGVWIAPARMTAEAIDLVDELELRDNTTVLVGQHVGGQELSRMVRESWDLDAIDEGYRTFIGRHHAALEGLERAHPDDVPPRDAFTLYMRALDDWRVLPMRDPGLPPELLPGDWSGRRAVQLIEQIVTRLEPAALAYVRGVVSGGDRKATAVRGSGAAAALR